MSRGRMAVAVGGLAALVVGGAAAAAVLTGTSSGTAGPRSSAPSQPSAPGVHAGATVVRHYEAWTPDGRVAAGLHVVTASGDASCWEGSIVAARPDAYRCSTQQNYDGGNLFDPCFASPTDIHRMLCPSDRLSDHRVVAVTSGSPGPSNPPRAGAAEQPWDLELAGGVSCRAVSGATDVIAGQRANYVCSDGRWLWGEADTSTALWTIRSSPSIHPSRFSRTAITTAWL
ncbi:MAG: hypothetical protein ACJ735_11265 [Actinomycetes bacterium]